MLQRGRAVSIRGSVVVAFLPLWSATLVAIGAGDPHTCGRTQAGETWCFGAGESGDLAALENPVPPRSPPASSSQAGQDHKPSRKL
jgi:hypothetical protein